MKVTFAEYVGLSTLATTGVVSYAYTTRLQFYPAVIFLVTSKPAIMVLFNQALVLTILSGMSLTRLFLGRLRESEKENVYENLRYSFTEMCLALSTFREEMSHTIVVLFVALLFTKIFHWLCEARVEHMEQAQDTSRMSHFRIVLLMLCLLLVDFGSTGVCLSMVQQYGASVHVYFGFEYAILTVKVVEIFVKYCLAAIDCYFIQGQWYNKSIYQLYLKLVIDVAQLFLNVIFFAAIFTFYGVPLHLMRQLYIAIKNVHDRFQHFIRFRRITANLHDRFPDATEEDLAATDRVCIICREELVADSGLGAPKKLAPCGHIFHFFCLRNWLERQLRCPTCRNDISTSPPRAAAADAGVNRGGDAGIAGAGAGPGAGPEQAEQRQPAPIPPDQQPQIRGAGFGGGPPEIAERPPVPRWMAEDLERIEALRRANQQEVAQQRHVQEVPQNNSSAEQQRPQVSNNHRDGTTPAAPPPASAPSISTEQSVRPPFPWPPTPQGIPAVPLPYGFPMGYESHSRVGLPSIAQHIQGQIEILQLQLQVYQAQANAAHATRKAALAAIRAQQFRSPVSNSSDHDHSKTSDLKEEKVAEEFSSKNDGEEQVNRVEEVQPAPAPDVAPHATSENTLRQRAAQAALARSMTQRNNSDSSD